MPLDVLVHREELAWSDAAVRSLVDAAGAFKHRAGGLLHGVLRPAGRHIELAPFTIFTEVHGDVVGTAEGFEIAPGGHSRGKPPVFAKGITYILSGPKKKCP